MPKLPRVSAARLVRALRRAGFAEDHQVGSHLTLIHPTTGQRVVVPMHPGDLPIGLLHDILKQAGLTGDGLRQLLR